eukprot:683102-Prymnesium_polylepis.1
MCSTFTASTVGQSSTYQLDTSCIEVTNAVSLGFEAFYQACFESITLPASLTSVGEKALFDVGKQPCTKATVVRWRIANLRWRLQLRLGRLGRGQHHHLRG